MKRLVLALAGAAIVTGAMSSLVLAKGRAGHCGENMFYSYKLHKCVDAREKTG